jgi:hypothetical protein
LLPSALICASRDRFASKDECFKTRFSKLADIASNGNEYFRLIHYILCLTGSSLLGVVALYHRLKLLKLNSLGTNPQAFLEKIQYFGQFGMWS